MEERPADVWATASLPEPTFIHLKVLLVARKKRCATKFGNEESAAVFVRSPALT